MNTVLPFLKPLEKVEGEKLWEWLRRVADELEKDGSHHPTDFGVLTVIRHTKDGEQFLQSSRKFNCNLHQVVGALYLAAKDFDDET